jgi:hypothetical protein
MLTFILAFVLLVTIMVVMSVGVIFQNKPIKGSCGGMAALGMVSDCEICGGDRIKCDEENGRISVDENDQAGSAQFYDASKSDINK